MRVSLIKIRNILGLEELDVAPGTLTEAIGANGTGKTSLIEALKAVVSGGHDATLIRKGAEAGEVVLVLDDGTEIRRRITPATSTTTIKDPARGKVGKPQSYIERIIDALSANPVAFLTAPPAKRAEYLLEVMPLALSADELAGIVDDGTARRYAGDNALESLARLAKQLYDERTGTNRELKSKRAHAAELEKALPPGIDEKDWAAEVSRLQAESNVLQDHAASARTEYEQAMGLLRRSIDGKYAAEEQRIRDEANRQLRELQDRKQAELTETDAKGRAALDEVLAEIEPKRQAIVAEISRALEICRQAERANATRSIIERTKQEAEQLEAESERLSQALAALDELKKQKLAALPIPGLEIRDGQIYQDGVPFDRLNKAKQVAISMRVARLRAGELGLCCVDNLECLDQEMFAAFERAALRSGLQMVISRVGSGPLEVRTMDPE